MHKLMSKIGRAELSFSKWSMKRQQKLALNYSPVDGNPVLLTEQGLYFKLTVRAGEQAFPRPEVLPL